MGTKIPESIYINIPSPCQASHYLWREGERERGEGERGREGERGERERGGGREREGRGREGEGGREGRK